MQLQLRNPVTGRLPMRASRWRGFRGLGDGTCQTPQAGVLQVYPPCTGNYTGVPTPIVPATYVAPAPIPVPACAFGPSMNTQECQTQLNAAEQARLAAASAANYAVDRANCEDAWAANAQRYNDLGLPVPPNDCAQRTFGLTLPGTTGGTNTLLPNAQQLLDPNYSGPAYGVFVSSDPLVAPNPQLSFTNLTSGDNHNFKVGDRWQIMITGAPPNAQVSVNGGLNGNNTLNQMGTTDSSGRFSLNGQMDQSQIGNWMEAWRVNDQIVSSFTFTVAPSGSVTNTGGGQSTQTSTTLKSVFGTLPGGSVSIGGTDVPVMALGIGAVVLFFMMRGK